MQPINSHVGTPTCKCVVATRILDDPIVVVECNVILETRVFLCTKGHNNAHIELPRGQHNACRDGEMIIFTSASTKTFRGPIIYNNHSVSQVQLYGCNPMWEIYKEVGIDPRFVAIASPTIVPSFGTLNLSLLTVGCSCGCARSFKSKFYHARCHFTS